jgi:hypothetical protein
LQTKYKFWISFVLDISHSEKNSSNYIINAPKPLCNKYSLFFSDFKPFLNFSKYFRQVFKYQNSWIFVQWEPNFSRRTERRMYGYTKSPMLVLSFRSLVNASKERYNEYVGRNKWPRYTVVLFTCRHQ